MEKAKVKSIGELIERTGADFRGTPASRPWFRGEPNNPKDGTDKSSELLPKLYRLTEDGRTHNENQLLQNFRLKAPALKENIDIPPRQGHTDQWLFLAQHVRLPTRLLDWTESLMVALYFALPTGSPVIWMLDPISLNNLSINEDDLQIDEYEFPLTWIQHEGGPINIGNANIRSAWESDRTGTRLPVAILPSYVHHRMHAQRSCFTIHGRDKSLMSNLVHEPVLRKYVLDPDCLGQMSLDFKKMGISQSVVFPDLDGLAAELSDAF